MGRPKKDGSSMPFTLDKLVHFQNQPQALLPWEVLISDVERDQLDITLENACSKNGHEKYLKFQFVPVTKELYGSKREMIFPIQTVARTTPATTTVRKKGPAKAASRASTSVNRVKTRPVEPPAITGWKADALAIIEKLASKFDKTWNDLICGQSKLPFYNDVIGCAALNYAIIKMKLATTKSDVKDQVNKNDEEALGYDHSFRWLSDIRQLFAQQFIYLQRVSRKDTSTPIPQPTDTNAYPSTQELDLMEVDLTQMAQTFEKMVMSYESLSPKCCFQGEALEKRTSTKTRTDIENFSEILPTPTKRSLPDTTAEAVPTPPSKRLIKNASPESKKAEMRGLMKKASQGDVWALELIDQAIETETTASSKKRAHNSRSYGLKENVHIPVAPPQKSALDIPDLPSIPDSHLVQPSQFEKAKAKAHQIFAELDVIYRYAILTKFSFDLGIHPTVCATDIDFYPDIDLLLNEQIQKYIYWTKWLLQHQQKMCKVLGSPICKAERTTAPNPDDALSDSDDELDKTDQSATNQPVIGSLQSIGGSKTIKSAATGETMPVAVLHHHNTADDSSSSVSSSISSSPPPSPGPDDESMATDANIADEGQTDLDDEDDDLETALLGGEYRNHSGDRSNASSDEALSLGFTTSNDSRLITMDEVDDEQPVAERRQSTTGATWRSIKTAALHQNYCQQQEDEDDDTDR